MSGGFPAQVWQGETTPGRKIHVRFDLPETVVVEPPWSIYAARDDIQFDEYKANGQPANIIYDGVPQIGYTQGVARLSTGYIGMQPRVLDLGALHSRTTEQADILRLSAWQSFVTLAERPLFKQPDAASHPGLLTGAAADLATAADHFLTILRQAGATWIPSATAEPAPKGPAVTQRRDSAFELDVVGLTHAVFPPDQGFQLRWRVPGTDLDEHDLLFAFEFGGPLSPRWHGRFALAFGMNGQVTLSELQYDVSGPSWTWVIRDTWQYCDKQNVVNDAHWFVLIPHARRYIDFQSSTREVVRPLFGIGSQLGPPQLQARHYTVPEADVEAKRGTSTPIAIQTFFATGAGEARLWINRRLRMQVQVARLMYPPHSERVSQVVDAPRAVPWGSTATTTLRTWYEGVLPFASATVYTSPSISCSLINDTTGVAIQAVGGSFVTTGGTANYVLPGGANTMRVRYRMEPGGPVPLTSGGPWSCWILAFELRKPARTAVVAPGEVEGGEIQSVSITGADSDPSTETAQVVIADPRNELSRVRIRGRMPVLIETEYDEQGVTGASALFRGYLSRATDMPRGRTGEWATGKTLPFTLRHDLDVLGVGQWARLWEAQWHGYMLDLAELVDPSAISPPFVIPNQPAKITSIVRELLQHAGYPPAQIDVPDREFRLWKSPQTKEDLYKLQPYEPLGPFITRLLRDYMGAYIFWDANATGVGALHPGMWRFQDGPRAGTLRWTFRTTTPTSVEPKLVNHPGAWGANTTFIRKDTLHSYVVPPEANAIWVTTDGDLTPNDKPTGLCQWLGNPKSVNLPIFGGNTADPNHPDYIGRLIPRVIYDPDLATQNAVDFVARRYYDITCRARKVVEFTAPLVLLADADPLYGGKLRPLRYGDTVLIDTTQYLVTAMNPDLGPTKDAHQFMHLECEEIVA